MADMVVRLNGQLRRFTRGKQAVQFNFEREKSAPVAADLRTVQKNTGVMRDRVETQVIPLAFQHGGNGDLPAVQADARIAAEFRIRILIVVGRRHGNRLPRHVLLQAKIPHAGKIRHCA